MTYVGVLRRGVIAPDRQSRYRRHRCTRTARELGDRAVVVEPRHRGEPGGRHIRRMGACDEGVGVRGVADDEHPDVVGRPVVDGASLGREDAAVGLEEIPALHAGGARPGSYEQSDARPVESGIRVVTHVDGFEQGKRAVLEFHRHSLGSAQRLRDLQQAQAHWHVGSEHGAGSDAEQERIADLAGSAGDGDDHSLDPTPCASPAHPHLHDGGGPLRR
jgi:hypothetical protein